MYFSIFTIILNQQFKPIKMKQFFTLTLFLLGSIFTQAQFTVATHDGSPITDGSYFTFSQLGEDASLTFDITNTTGSTIDMRIQLVSMTNANGTGTWLCVFGSCLAPGSLDVGEVFPNAGTNEFTTIDAGVTSDYGDHFYNTYVGDGTNYPIEYTFKFYAVDGSGNQTGSSVTFTYKYDGTAAIEDLNQITYQIYPTISDDFINIILEENIDAQMINMQGQLIKNYSFTSGQNIIDVRQFSKQIYYLILTNKQGQKALSKLIFN
jgi:hypothetical protein